MPTLVLALAALLGLNIGGSGAGASMAAAHASGVLGRRAAMGLFAACALVGALLGGHRVVATVGGRLVPASAFTPHATLAVAAAAAAALIMAHTLRVPQSTTQVMVAAVAGVGLAHGALQVGILARIVLAWCINPLLAFLICHGAGRLLPLVAGRLGRSAGGRRLQALLVTAASSYMALGIGMNNVANAVAPLVAGRILDTATAVRLGGLLLAAGGLLIGPWLVSTTGREIARLDLLAGALVCVVTASLTIAASTLGLPTSYVQTSTLAVLGVTASDQPLGDLLRRRVVQRIGLTWVASPTLAFLAGLWLQR